MKKLLSILAFLVLSSVAKAQTNCPSTSGTVAFLCAAGATTADVAAAISAATDGAVITFSAGTYTNIIFPKVSNSKGVTLICATAPLAVGAATVNPCLINVHVSGTSSSSVFGTDALSGNNTHFYRISGFTFDGGGSTVSPSFGTIYFDSYNGNLNATMSGPGGKGGLRIDHNTFQDYKTGSQTFLCSSVASPVEITNCYGVIDHNLYTNPTQISMAIWVGDFPNPIPTQPVMGTVNNLFMENNTLTFAATGNTSAEGCVDDWIGPYVIRYNTATNCLWLAHGETHRGGPPNWEFYNNSTTITDTTTGVGDCTEQVHLQGSGIAMFFNNTCTPAAGQGHTTDGFQIQHYRGGAGTAGSSFAVTGVTVSGTCPASCTVTYTGTFPGVCPAPTPCGWYNFSGFSNAGNNIFTQITSSTSTTLVGIGTRSLGTQVTETHAATANFSSQDGSAPQCDGTVASPATVIWATTAPDGNRSPIATNRGYPCGNQPGRDLAGNIQPIYGANNLFTDNRAILSIKYGGVGGVIDYSANHMQSQREFFDEVGNTAQTTTSSPFNGTTGTGWGTLANRPTTCTSNTTENAFGAGTSGVGYYATDVGPQGTWYKCTATNTWTSFYTPFTYPHPLIAGAQAATPVFNPGTGTYGGATTVTISSTLGTVLCWNTSGSPVTAGNGSTCTTGTAITTNSGANCVASSSVCGNITVSSSETVYAVAGTSTLLDSTVASAVYTISTNGITHIGIGASVHVGTMVLE
jgi:hypothetical protein